MTQRANTMLKIENLSVRVDGKDILRKINLEIKKAEIHALMGFSGGDLNSKKSYLKFIVRSPLLSIIR